MEAGALACLFALIWAPFLWRAAAGLTALSAPLTHDVGFQWIPFKIFMRRALSQGMPPLWAPEVFAGFPFAAFSHTGVFYPPGWLLLGDYARAVNFFYPLHLCIAGSGVYALCRRLKLGPAAAWFAAFSYVFTGKPFYFIHFLPATCSNAWVPWFLASLVSLVQRGRMAHLWAAAVFLGLQVLGGDVESTSYALLFSAPFLGLVMWRSKAAPARLSAVAASLSLAACLALVQLLPLAELSHVFVRNQGVTFSYFSQRHLPWSLIWAALLPVTGAQGFAGVVVKAPNFYLGVMTISLAGLAFIARAERGSRFLGLLVIAVMAWSLGSIGLIDRFQALLPVLGRFGTPEHAYFMGQLFLVILAGQGLQKLMAHSGREAGRWAVGALIAAAAMVALGAVGFELLSCPAFTLGMLAAGLAALIALVRCRPVLAGRGAAAVFILIGSLDIYSLAFKYLPKNAPSDFDYSRDLAGVAGKIRASHSRYIFVSDQGLSDPELLYHAGLALGMDEADGWITVPPRRYAEFLALMDSRAVRYQEGRLDQLGINSDLRDGRFIEARSMPVLDLISLRWIIDRGLPLKFSSPFFLYLSPPEFHRRTVLKGEAAKLEASVDLETGLDAMAIAAAANELYRYKIYIQAGDALAAAVEARHADVSRGGASWSAEVEAVAGDTSRVLFREQGVSRPLNAGSGGGAPPRRVIDLSGFAGKTIELSLITKGPADRPDLVFLWRPAAIVNESSPIRLRAGLGRGLFIYENNDALPRAFVAHRAEVVDDGEELLERLGRENRYELSRKVFLERDSGGIVDELRAVVVAPGRKDTAALESRRPGEEVYRVDSAGPGLLFVSDQYYAGWRAYVRGREAPILRADYNFRAVPVPDGVSVVRMVFRPASFRMGLFASVVSWFCVIAGAIFFGRGQARKA
ncbi:MAG TPA: hypothetical protein VM658_05645 [bacterium]|nr:hypothetical protein [bacterium]